MSSEEQSKTGNEKRKLVIGDSGYRDFETVSWQWVDSVNIQDFDVIFIFVESFPDILRSVDCKRDIPSYEKIDSIVSSVKKSLEIVLLSNGTVVVFGDAHRTYFFTDPVNDDNTYEITNYSWSPVGFSCVNEEGSSKVIRNKKYESYFDNVERWLFYIKDVEYKKDIVSSEEELVLYGKPFTIAVNRYNGVLGFEYMYYYSKGDKDITPLGSFLFLHKPSEGRIENGFNEILKKQFGIKLISTPPPAWINEIEMAEVDDLNLQLEQVNDKIEELVSERDKINSKIEEVLRYRSILYEKDTNLKEAVRDTFILLAGPERVIDPGINEYFMFEHDKKKAIIYLKARTDALRKEDVKALDDVIAMWEIEKEEEVKGILVGNPWRLIEPKIREERTHNAFTEGVIEFALKREIGLLSTIELFNVYTLYREKVITFARMELAFDFLVDKRNYGVLDLRKEIFWDNFEYRI